MESVVSTVVIYDSKGERYSLTPEKWREACRMQRNEKALMEFVENQKHALDFEQVMLFMVKNRLVGICNEDGRPLTAEETSEEIEKAEETVRMAEAALKGCL